MKKILYIIVVLILGLHEAQAIENNCPNPNIADVFYSDGTCSTDYIASKDAIGIIYWLGAKKKGGLIMALDEPTRMDWSNAISYCNSYNKYGVAGWKLPEIGDIFPLLVKSRDGISNNINNILNIKLASISGTNQLSVNLYRSASETYNVPTNANMLHLENGAVYYFSKNELQYVRCVLAF